MEAYCVKCKAKKHIAKTEDVTYKNGRHAKKGKCPDCSTTVCKIVAKGA